MSGRATNSIRFGGASLGALLWLAACPIVIGVDLDGASQGDGGGADAAAASDASTDLARSDAAGRDAGGAVDVQAPSDRAGGDSAAPRPDAAAADARSSDARAADASGPGGLSVYDLQDPSRPAHPQPGTQVALAQVVVTAVDPGGSVQGFWVQDPAGGAYSGIFVYKPASAAFDLGSLDEGRRVAVSGEYKEYNDLSEVQIGEVSVGAAGAPLAPVEVANPGADPEAWEGVLIRVCGGCEVQALLDYGEVQTSCALLDDEIASLALEVGDRLECVTGIWHYAFGSFRLLPRRPEDLGAGAGSDAGPRIDSAQCPGAAACGERQCGPDPVCGVSCGECETGFCDQAGACVACRDHRDCAASEYCDAAHTCQLIAGSGSCRSTQTDCEAGQRCDLSTLRCETCTSEPGSCPYREEGSHCFQAADCGDRLHNGYDFACTPVDYTCENRVCHFYCYNVYPNQTECTFNPDCGLGLWCNGIDYSTGYGSCSGYSAYEDGPCDPDDPDACKGLFCYDGTCGPNPGCDTRADCPRNPSSSVPSVYECVEHSCVPFFELRCARDADCGAVANRRCATEIGYCTFAAL